MSADLIKTDVKGLSKRSVGKAVVNTDLNALKAYKQRRHERALEQNKYQQMEADINSLKAEVKALRLLVLKFAGDVQVDE